MFETISRRKLPGRIGTRLALAGLVTAAAVPLAAGPALANRLHCEQVLVGSIVHAPTELAGKREALARWLALAGQLGPEYTRWQNAFNRELACAGATDRGYRCQAAGQPCKPVYSLGPNARILPRVPAPSALDPSITGKNEITGANDRPQPVR